MKLEILFWATLKKAVQRSDGITTAGNIQKIWGYALVVNIVVQG